MQRGPRREPRPVVLKKLDARALGSETLHSLPKRMPESARMETEAMRKATAGFTLIELLIVVVIIGLLAGIALPKLLSTKEKAGIAAMKSDLRNLATAQESYWNDYKTYYGGAVPSAQMLYSPTPSVAITITVATDAGWGATATQSVAPKTCALFVGGVAPPPPAVAEGQIACQ